MTNEQILNYLEQPKDSELLKDLDLIIFNDGELYNKYILNLVSYFKKYTKRKDFNKIQFLQLIKNNIDLMLNDKILNNYGYNKNAVSVANRYHLANIIYNYILEF